MDKELVQSCEKGRRDNKALELNRADIRKPHMRPFHHHLKLRISDLTRPYLWYPYHNHLVLPLSDSPICGKNNLPAYESILINRARERERITEYKQESVLSLFYFFYSFVYTRISQFTFFTFFWWNRSSTGDLASERMGRGKTLSLFKRGSEKKQH